MKTKGTFVLIMVVLVSVGMTNASLVLHNSLDNDNVIVVGEEVHVLDLAGNNDGVLIGSYIMNPGQIEQCIWTANRTGHVVYGNVLDPGTGSYTVTLWARRGAGGLKSWASKGNSGSTNPGWHILDGNGLVVMRVADEHGNNASTRKENATPLSGDWVHIAMVIDRSAGKIIGYLNGSNAGFAAGGYGPTTDSLDEVGNISNPVAPLVLGASAAGGGYGLGGFDDFAIWNRALSASEIQHIYEVGLLHQSWRNVLVVESDRHTEVSILGDTDTYEFSLAYEPYDPNELDDLVSVNIQTDGHTTIDVGGGPSTSAVLFFDPTNYDIPRSVLVAAAAGVPLEIGSSTITHTLTSEDPYYDDISIDLDVSINHGECGLWGYHPFDFDQNCYVDIGDLAIFASAWLVCTHPMGDGCIDLR